MRRIAAVLSVAALGLMSAMPASALVMSSINVSLTGEDTGKMGITLDQAKVQAGRVTFVVTNDAKTESHEMVVIKLASATAELPYDEAKQRVPENKVKHLGEVSDLKPGANKMLTLELAPGTYQLICNMKGHYKAGMSALVTVTK